MCHVDAETSPASRGMCAGHAATREDGRGYCTHEGCRRVCAPPYTLRKCKDHHPNASLKPLELEVVEQMAKGVKPVDAVVQVTGLTRPQASQKLSAMGRSAHFVEASRAALEEAGLSHRAILERLAENTQAVKTALGKDGEVHDLGRDYRASNTALDIALKIGGYYAPKKVEGDEKGPVFNIHQAIVVPSVKPLAPDTPIYAIPDERK